MKIRFVPQPAELMKDDIAVHWLEPTGRDRYKLKPGNVWVRDDWWYDKTKRTRLIIHELTELRLMLRGMPYTEAHKIASNKEHSIMRKYGIIDTKY